MPVSLKRAPVDMSKVVVTKLPTGASSGITKREWDRRVRGEREPIELKAGEEAWIVPPKRPVLKLRCGFGAVR